MRKILLPIVTVFCISALADEYVTSVALPSGETRQFKDAAAWQQIDSITQSISSIDFTASNETLVSTITGEFAKEPFSNAVLSVGLSIDTNTVAAINSLIENGESLPVGGAVTIGAILIALAAAVASLKKNKADSSSISYSLVEVQKGTISATNRAMNHVTEDRNNNGIWRDNYNDNPEEIPADGVSLVDGNLLFTKYGVLLTCDYYGEATSIEDLEPEEYSFIGSVDNPAVTLTPTTISNPTASGTLTLEITVHGVSTKVQVEGVEWGNSGYGMTLFGSFSYNDQDYTIEGTYGEHSTEENPIVTPFVGESINCQILDGNREATLNVDSVIVRSVTVDNASGEGTLTLAWPEKGLVFENLYYNLFHDDIDGGINLYVSGGGSQPSSFLDFWNSEFFVNTGTNFPLVGTTYNGEGVAVITVLLSLDKPAISLNPPSEEVGKVRDFLVVADATTDNLPLQISGVEPTSQDTFTLDAGRNLIYVTEAVQGRLYASRKLVSEAR